MKANPGCKWYPTTNHHMKTKTSPVTNTRKVWAFASDSGKDSLSLRKEVKR